MSSSLKWKVTDMTMEHSLGERFPSATATVELICSPEELHQKWYTDLEIRNDLIKRLDDPPEVESLYPSIAIPPRCGKSFSLTMWELEQLRDADEAYRKLVDDLAYGRLEGMKYCLSDVRLTNAAVERMVSGNHFMIKKVIFNDPATIIKWRDGTKTVVKCQNGEPFDPEKGFVMAYLKKLLGNDNTFNKEIAKWVKEDNYVQEKQ